MHSHELTLGLAFGLGALHALEPGHGKTAMLLYLAGERRSLLHPLVMGISSALSHSLSLIGIAAMVHLTHHLVTGDHYHADEGVTDAMRWGSAGLVLIVGLWMLWSAWKSKASTCGCSHHKHDCDTSAEPIKLDPAKSSYSMSALLGAAFGLMPCPSAMAAYFSGLSSGNPMTSYIVIGLFAAGIATSLTVVGMLVQVFGSRLVNSKSRNKSWYSRLPWNYIRAGLITLIGLAYLGHVAFNQFG
jgi:ABC-type nickel/cobalt efflux system permease component RcnA